MPKAFFIGGAPRVGKTTLSLSVLQKHPMLGASTDAIRYTLRNVIPADQSPALFALRASELTDDELVSRVSDDPEKAIQYQNAESFVVWKSVVDFVKSNLEDGFDILIEGIAVLPELVTQVDFPYSAVFVGNKSNIHIQTTLELAANNPHDWLGQKSEVVAKAFCTFNQNFSNYIEAECNAHNQLYIEISDNDFEGSMRQALEALLNS